MANKKTIIGKTAPVPLGQQKAVNSLPVVFAEDQPAIPVEEQNKIQSEVALSLLGIPRAEVALGIFADVNTYDINPSEWSQFPIENDVDTTPTTGLNHLAEEAGAELVAATGRTTILTSKRFFRYQPGRVSSSTMGVKMNKTASTYTSDTANRDIMKGAPSIKKWGIFDKFDGYYYEIANGGDKNDFRCVRRTQALVYSQPSGLSGGDRWTAVASSAGKSNIKAGNWGVVGEDPVVYRNGLCYVAAAIHDPSLVYKPADVRAIEAGTSDVNDFEYDEGYAVRLAYRDTSNAFVEHMAGRQYQFPFDQKDVDKTSATYLGWKDNGEFLKPASEYIRLDTHCKWEDILTNLSRGGGTGTGAAGSDFSAQLNAVGDVVDTDPAHARYGYDTDPDEVNSGVKVWNLLVTVQGANQVSNTEFDAAFGEDSHRSSSKEYSTSGGSIGARNITLKEWFKLCVPPEYRYVYEWRPVRAMFSGDQLNGSSNVVRWSDVSTANVDPAVIGVKRPGDPVTLDNAELTAQSQYNIDFSKVTMWKIEFSWYGAVGALFLCYVPVGNGEARWVRVHHMRASNQLDVASLGNATLPITYLTHGGLENNLTEGNTLVKYGASYYIDGGDKGTVRLLSKSTDTPKGVKYGVEVKTASNVAANTLEIPFAEDNRDQLIGAYLKADTTTRVIWATEVSSGVVKLYFNRAMADIGVTAGTIELVVPRKQRAMIALRAKDNVINTTGTPVRNRVQLYPLKYGAGLTDGTGVDNIVSLNFIKNPLLITNNLNNSGMSSASLVSGPTSLHDNAAEPNKGFTLGSGTVPKEIVTSSNLSGDLSTVLSQDGFYYYGYVRAKPTNDVGTSGFDTAAIGVDETELLVKFYRKGGKFYVQNHDSQSVSMSIYIGNGWGILYTKMYTFSDDGTIGLFTGTIGSVSTNHNKYENQKKWDAAEVGNWESIASLSGAKISQDFKLSPVANTGNNVFSIYANKGGSQYDLEDYFAYNKEYISFPLTNEVDILGVYSHWESTSAAPASAPTTSIDIVNSLTWEEQ